MTAESVMKVDLRSNNLLKALHNRDQQLLLPHMKEISVERGKVLYEPGDDVKHSYFPCDQECASNMELLRLSA